MRWLENNWPWVLELTLQHVALAIPSIVVSLVLAVALGRVAHRVPRLRHVVLGGASMVYAIPALPLLIVVPAAVGIPLRSPVNLVIAVALYGSALLVGTATDAFDAVDARVRESAEAMGYGRRGMFWRVDLPLATPVLLSGLRVVTVSTVGLVTIGALVGISSLGTLLTDGFQRGLMNEVLVGIGVTMTLALLLDGLLVLGGRRATPWESRRSHGTTPSAREQESVA